MTIVPQGLVNDRNTLQVTGPTFPNAPLPRPGWSDLIAVVVVGTILLLWRFETIFLPGYQDQSSGPWTEAKFLADSSFDYIQLRYGVNHYMDFPPGPRCYMISVLPTLLAVWMKLVPDVSAQLASIRVFSFLCGALTVVLLYRVIRAWTTITGAVVLCAAFATLPAFITQVEIMGMDVPLAPLMLLSLICLMRHRFGLAAAWAAVAFAVKASGMLAVLVGIAYLSIVLALGASRIDRTLRQAMLRALGVNVFVLACMWALVLWGDTSLGLRSTFPWPSLLKPPYSVITQTPELGILAFILGFLSVRRTIALIRFESGDNWTSRLCQAVLSERAVVISWIAIVGLVGASCIYMYTSRYVYCVIPFLFIVFAREVFADRSWRPWTFAVGITFISFNLANTSGALYPSPTTFGKSDFDRIPGLTVRLCVFTERSREYLADHRSNIAALAVLDARPDGEPIFAPAPYLFLMRNPAAGYVKKPLHVLDGTRFAIAIEQFLDLYAPASGSPCPDDPVFLYYGDSRVSLPEPKQDDEILYEDNLSPPVIVFRKQLPPGSRGDRTALEKWYLDESWSKILVGPRVAVRAEYLIPRGLIDRFNRELEEAIRLSPDDPRLQNLILSEVQRP